MKLIVPHHMVDMTSLRLGEKVEEEQCSPLKTELISIYVGNLSGLTTKSDLERLFKEFGIVRDVYINKKHADKKFTFGFVRYDNMKSCLEAIDVMHGHRLRDHTLIVSMSEHSKQNVGGEHRDYASATDNVLKNRKSPEEPPEEKPLGKNRISLHALKTEVERQCDIYNTTFIKKRQAEGRGKGLCPIDANVIINAATEARYQCRGPFFRDRNQRTRLDLSELARIVNRECPDRPCSPVSGLCTRVKDMDVSNNDSRLLGMTSVVDVPSGSLKKATYGASSRPTAKPLKVPSPEAIQRFAPDGASEDESRSESKKRVVDTDFTSQSSITGKGRGSVLRALMAAWGDKEVGKK